MHDNAILSALIKTATTLIKAGHPVDKVMDGMLTLTTAWSVAHEGPEVVARRLYMLALQFAAEAERQEPGPGERPVPRSH
jgi:hypothetical protein